jgi:hypothetical protein
MNAGLPDSNPEEKGNCAFPVIGNSEKRMIAESKIFFIFQNLCKTVSDVMLVTRPEEIYDPPLHLL